MSKKIDIKRLSIFLVLVAVIIAVIVIIVVNSKGDNDITLDGTQDPMSGGSMNNNAQIEYDGNPYNVPEIYAENVPEFIDEQGQEIDDATMENIKSEITNKFKSLPADKLGLSTDPQTAHLVFNKGTTKIADYTCVVFAVYENVENSLVFKSKFAMTIDTNTLYSFDSETLMYNMIELK